MSFPSAKLMSIDQTSTSNSHQRRSRTQRRQPQAPCLPTPTEPFSFLSLLTDILRLPEETLATSYLYFHRYRRFFAQTREQQRDPLDAHTLALASLSLASKATESPRRLREFIIPAWRILHSSAAIKEPEPLRFPSTVYDALRATLVQAELILLRVLRFELRTPLALDFLPQYLDRALFRPVNDDGYRTEDYDCWSRDDKDEYKVVEMMETGIARAVRGKVVEAYRNYQLANFFPARAVAVACIFWVMRDEALRIGDAEDALGRWVDNVTGGKVDRDDFDEVLVELDKENVKHD